MFYVAGADEEEPARHARHCVAPPDRRESSRACSSRETTTIGVRYQEMRARRLEREIVTVETPLGPVRFKVASRDGRVLNAAPSSTTARASPRARVPIKDVQAIAMKAWLERQH